MASMKDRIASLEDCKDIHLFDFSLKNVMHIATLNYQHGLCVTIKPSDVGTSLLIPIKILKESLDYKLKKSNVDNIINEVHKLWSELPKERMQEINNNTPLNVFVISGEYVQ